jgi:short-subunit dehydrogenase
VENLFVKKSEQALVTVNTSSLSIDQCALGIFEAAESNEREVWLPKYLGLAVPLLNYYFPSLVDSLAKNKYGYQYFVPYFGLSLGF